MKRHTTPVFLICAFLTAFMLSAVEASGQIKKPVKWTFSAEPISDSEVLVTATARIDNGWSVYSQFSESGGPAATEFTYPVSPDYTPIGKTEESGTPKKYFDSTFLVNVISYAHTVTFRQKFRLHVSAATLEGTVLFMACTNQECLLPETLPFKVELTAVKPLPRKAEKKKTEKSAPVTKPGKSDPPDNPQPKTSVPEKAKANSDTLSVGTRKPVTDIPEPKIVNRKSEIVNPKPPASSLWTILIAGFIGGLLAFLMPCIFPMVPFTISYFTKRSNDSRSKTIRLAALYGVSIIVIYVVLGLVITLIFGSDALNNLSTSGVFNIFFFLLLVVFAASLFGAFEITLPSSWVNKADSAASKEGTLGIFFMAATLALVSFSCTGPIIGTLLVEAASSQSYLGPATGMLGFSSALALIFVGFALFPSALKSMPRSGGWLNSVKVSLGFLELALAFKFLSNVDLAYHWNWFDREVFLVLWIVTFGCLGFYLLGKLTLPGDSELKNIKPVRLFLGMITLAFALYMVPGLWGAPLKAIAAFLPPQHTQDFDLYSPAGTNVKGGTGAIMNADAGKRKYQDLFEAPLKLNVFFDYDEAKRYAQQNNKPIMIDFTGHACVNCRKMESVVWSDPRILDRLQNDYVLVQLYVDDKTELPEAEQFTSPYSGKQIKTIGNKWSDLQAAAYNTNSQPYYVLLDADENLLAPPQGAEYNIDLFKEFLDSGLTKFRTD